MRTPILVYCWLILKTTSYEWRGLCYKQSNVPVHAKEGVAPTGYEKDNPLQVRSRCSQAICPPPLAIPDERWVNRRLASDSFGVACLGVCAAETRNG